MKEEHSLAKRLKALLDEDRHGRAARKIEEASTSIMGNFHFCYTSESKVLAGWSLTKNTTTHLKN
jgi:hypothetical protein